MFLKSAEVGPFKSINAPQKVTIEPTVTVLVGMNEAGKTVFLRALEKSADVFDDAKFEPVDDYPRKDLSAYLKTHKDDPAQAVVLTYRLSSDEVSSINTSLHTKLPADFEFSITHKYDNHRTIGIQVDESSVIANLAKDSTLSTDVAGAVKKAKSLREIPGLLADVSLTDEDKSFLAALNARITKADKEKWTNVVQWEVWQWLSPRIPQFLYFSDYYMLPDKTNLTDLATRAEQAKSDPKRLDSGHRAALALLRMADISIADLNNPSGYEQLKAKIEAVSISLTDQVMKFWKQNEELEVEVDIKQDSKDDVPFNNGANLYLRIKNRRHRVTTSFAQRSRGFIWFFSFLVWFDSVKQQVNLEGAGAGATRSLILLLDEPGLALHALAQADFLRYIDDLSTRHQVLYTTHSPFMVHSDRLNQVRVVEDKDKVGTVLSDNVGGSDPRTIFPLQAALGWTVAQNLFITKRNLLVEGPSELIYLKTVSAMLESQGRTGLKDDVTIVPVGGLDKVVTFVALLGANGLKLSVLHDYKGAPEQKLFDLVKSKILSPKALLNVSQFRDLKNLGKDGPPTDTEDLLGSDCYVSCFNDAFAKELKGKTISVKELPAGDRIVERIEKYLAAKAISLRPSGGFNHYRVAAYFASNPPKALSSDVLDRFEALFKTINSLY